MKINRDDVVSVDLYPAQAPESGPAFREVNGKYLGLNTAVNAEGVHMVALDIGPVVGAHVAAGRFVFGPSAPAADGSEITETPILDATHVEETPVIGILYLGPADGYAQAELMKLFGPQVRWISHATPTDAQAEAYAKSEPRAALTLYVGTIPTASAENIMKCSDILTAAAHPSFPQIVSVLPEQIEEARANAPEGMGLAALIVGNAATTV